MHTKSVPIWVVALLLLPFGSLAQEADSSGELEDAQTATLPLDGQSTPEGTQAPPDEMTAAERTKFLELDGRPIQQFNNVDIADYLALESKAVQAGLEPARPGEEAGKIARRTFGQPFRLNAVQLDAAEGDCVSCVNRQLALSLAWDWQSYVILIERIRHKDGVVEYKNRNFFTLCTITLTPSLPATEALQVLVAARAPLTRRETRTSVARWKGSATTAGNAVPALAPERGFARREFFQ